MYDFIRTLVFWFLSLGVFFHKISAGTCFAMFLFAGFYCLRTTKQHTTLREGNFHWIRIQQMNIGEESFGRNIATSVDKFSAEKTSKFLDGMSFHAVILM